MAASILGTWYISNGGENQSRVAITFLGNGTYILADVGNHALDPSGQSGIEVGTYTWNPTTGSFSYATQVNTDGEWGLSNSGINSVQTSGDSLTFSGPDGGGTLTRVAAIENSIIGTWYATNSGDNHNTVAATFLGNGTFFLAVAGNNAQDPSGHSGVEMGTYSWNAATGSISYSIQVDTNGEWGVSNSGITSAQVNGNVLTFTSPEGSFQISRADGGTVAAGTPITIDASTSTGDDRLSTPGGSAVVNGGSGVDTLVLNGALINYSITKTATGYTLTDNTGVDGTVTLTNVERLHFTDKDVAFDTAGIAGEAYRLYKAAFDRTPDLAGLGYWIGQMDNDYSLQNVAKGFIASAEFQMMYGPNSTDQTFVRLLYNHVLGRDPDQGGYDYWLNQLSHGETRANVLVDFSESAENVANVAPIIAVGIPYIEY